MLCAKDSCSSAFAWFRTHLVTFTDLKARTYDAVGPGRVAFQMMLLNKHTMNMDGLRDIVKAVGATNNHPLRFCFVTTKAQYEGRQVPNIFLPTWLPGCGSMYCR